MFFDVDAIADTSSGLPHMLPSLELFARAMRGFGIEPETPVVVYDSTGIFSAPRVWWTLRAFGARRVAILNGGLPRWEAEGYPLESAMPSPAAAAVEAATGGDGGGGGGGGGWALNHRDVRTLRDILENQARRADDAEIVIDARPAARFLGTAAEPRANVRSGHMPRARSLPSSALLDPAKFNAFRAAAEIRSAFAAAGVDTATPRGITLSCGSGVTACVLYAALAIAGRPAAATAVYDGSWSEYGATPDVPVVKGPADE